MNRSGARLHGSRPAPAGVSAMVLAAGLATRLRPLTDALAKPVVPFLNRPLLDYTLEWLARCGFHEVIVNLHHAPDSIIQRFGGHAYGMRLRYSFEEHILGTGGGPRRVLDELEETLLVVNGDVVAWVSLGALLRAHRARGAMATLALHSGSGAAGYPQVVASPLGALLGFPGDPVGAAEGTVRGVFTGIHLVQRQLLETIPSERFCGIVDPVYRCALEAGLRIDALAVPGAWYEVGDAPHYLANQFECLARGQASLATHRTLRYTDAAYVSHHTQLENVRLRPPFLMGAGTRIKHGSRIERTIAGDRCRISSGCDLREVVAWDDASIGPGCRLRSVVIMQGVDVPAATCAESVVFTASGPVPFEAGS